MSKYIDIERFKAEIERLKDENKPSDDKEYAQYELDVACGYDIACEEILSSITSLQQEQPEVDFEKELKNERAKLLDAFGPMNGEQCLAIKDFARHFFELGLNARKEV